MRITAEWRLRREIAGRVYEEEWRIRMAEQGIIQQGIKLNEDGSIHYANGARTNEGKVDIKAIEEFVHKNYPNLLPENATTEGSKWKKVDEKVVGDELFDRSIFQNACKYNKCDPFSVLVHSHKRNRGSRKQTPDKGPIRFGTKF